MTAILRQIWDGFTGAPRGVRRIFRQINGAITDFRWWA